SLYFLFPVTFIVVCYILWSVVINYTHNFVNGLPAYYFCGEILSPINFWGKILFGIKPLTSRSNKYTRN
uniref:Uncharacterized protein n=1 Tax=Ciona intestinalis TaxID=7719 RepID=H2Y341_CIOIN